MEVALPIVLGALGGAVGACAYPIAFAYLLRKHSRELIPAVIAVCVSLLLSVAIIFVGWFVGRDAFAPFAGAFLIVFLVMVAAATVWFVRKPRA